MTVGAWVASYRAGVKRQRRIETMVLETRRAVRRLQRESDKEELQEYISGKEEEG
jgi:hypothetical protein